MNYNPKTDIRRNLEREENNPIEVDMDQLADFLDLAQKSKQENYFNYAINKHNAKGVLKAKLSELQEEVALMQEGLEVLHGCNTIILKEITKELDQLNVIWYKRKEGRDDRFVT